MIDLVAAAEKVRAAVEAEEAEKFFRCTQAELDKIHVYQFTAPTSPKPGFVYKRQYWRVLGKKTWWTGTFEQQVRWAIGQARYARTRVGSKYYSGPLETTWFVYTCVRDPDDEHYVLHQPKEAKVIG